MKHLQNLHTHTSYCDGADTPEEIVLAAIDKGFESIGFSGHSYMSCSRMFLEKGDKTEEYKENVKSLKEKYKDRIKIYLGLEVEVLSAPDMNGYDYLIGSAHYFSINGGYVGFDRSAEEVKSVIDNYFNGNGMEYAKAYYKTLAELPEYGNFDIIGHFDLITKHSDNVMFFDEDSDEYKKAALEAAHALKGKIPFFEVNTGAIARGYRKTPYPSMYILKELKNLGFGAVISSDCHNKAMLDCNFNEAVEMLRECGFKEKYILTDSGFSAVAL
ncbi:MAG: histidinol-phosphatase [Clostridia bacterium]|nr:histidinol-phosphatase [Clostridia bacterium]MBQ8758538.1 histidinol-phosphatase [Clostridia bacterium]